MKLGILALCIICTAATDRPMLTRQMGFTGAHSLLTPLRAGPETFNMFKSIIQSSSEVKSPPKGCAAARIIDFGSPVTQPPLAGVRFIEICNAQTIVARRNDAGKPADEYYKMTSTHMDQLRAFFNPLTQLQKPPAPGGTGAASSHGAAAGGDPEDKVGLKTARTNTYAFAVNRLGGERVDNTRLIPGGNVPPTCEILEKKMQDDGLQVAESETAGAIRAVLQTWVIGGKNVTDAWFVQVKPSPGGDLTCYVSKKGIVRATEDCASESLEKAVEAVGAIHSKNAAEIAKKMDQKHSAYIDTQTICETAFKIPRAATSFLRR